MRVGDEEGSRVEPGPVSAGHGSGGTVPSGWKSGGRSDVDFSCPGDSVAGRP